MSTIFGIPDPRGPGDTDNEPDDPIVHGGDTGEIEIVDQATGKVIGRTLKWRVGMSNEEMDTALFALENNERYASQEDLNHLFGIKRSPDEPSPDYDGSGDFS